jgi:hypothetical protein
LRNFSQAVRLINHFSWRRRPFLQVNSSMHTLTAVAFCLCFAGLSSLFIVRMRVPTLLLQCGKLRRHQLTLLVNDCCVTLSVCCVC